MDNEIEIDLDSRSEYVNEYDDNRLNDRLYQYILNYPIDIKQNVVFKVNFNYKASDDEIKIIKDMIKRSFSGSLTSVEDELKKLNYRDIILGGLGIIFLIVYWYLENYHVFIVSEFCLVITWVVFWQIIESLLFSRRELVIKKRKCQKLLLAKIDINNK